MLTLPASFVADVGTAVGANLTSIAPIAIAALAIPVGFFVIHQFIGLFPKSRARRA